MVVLFQCIGAVLMVLGSLFGVVAALGMLLLPDAAARLQAAAKPQVVGLLLILLGAAPFVRWWPALGMLFLVGAFQVVTAPVLTQLLARDSYRSGAWRRDRLLVDEYEGHRQPGGRDDASPGGDDDASG